MLDNFANREITDSMDRLPKDVASERLHHDIVRLLNDHVPRSPHPVSVIPSGPLLGPGNAEGKSSCISFFQYFFLFYIRCLFVELVKQACDLLLISNTFLQLLLVGSITLSPNQQ